VGALAAPLGISVERMAERNGGSLPALFSNPEAQKWNSVKKCVSGIRGGACFTLNNMGAFPIM